MTARPRRGALAKAATAGLAGALLLSPLLLQAAQGVAGLAAPKVLAQASASASAAPPAGSAAPATSSSSSILADPGAPVKAYSGALAAAKLGGSTAMYGPEEVREIVAVQQEAFIAGRLDEVVSTLTGVVESPRFDIVKKEPEARAAYRLLGEALREQGVHALARHYLRKAAAGPAKEGPVRAATRTLTEIALDDEAYDEGIKDLEPIVAAAPTSDELKGELAYLRGRKAEAEDDAAGADKHYATITTLSRFWSAATYRRGLLLVDQKKYNEAEALFCQVADPKRQDKSAPVFADERFFAVRDLARLALGRLAHEGYRYDDARYYYYLVPQDSKRLAEALYESATARYEAKDYDGARELLDELATYGEGHVYDDEARVLDVYVDVAQCKFEDAAKKLDKFLVDYVPVRDRAHLLATAPDSAILAFLNKEGADTGKSIDVDARLYRRLEGDPALLFVLRARRRLQGQLAGLGGTDKQLDGLAGVVGAGGKAAVKPAIDPTKLGSSDAEKADELMVAIEALRKEIAALKKAGAKPSEIEALEKDLDVLTTKADGFAAAKSDASPAATGAAGLPALVSQDAVLAKTLRGQGEAIMAELDAIAIKLARAAIGRLDRRASRLVARARLAKIDVVLGQKKGLEVEVDALKSGVLPKSAIDSVNAARYLEDNEEYWPFEGDEWLDEVIGVEQGEK